MKTVLFYRWFRRFTGGDLKVWDYFNHVLAAPGYEAFVQLSEQAKWDASNPWWALRDRVIRGGAPMEHDLLFLSGVDWRWLPERERDDWPVPIVNLVQHILHADPNDRLKRRTFLRHKAIRICVSPEVAEAVLGTGEVRGPLFTIPDAIDVGDVAAHAREERDVDLLLVASKRRKLGQRLLERLEGPARRIVLLDEIVPRADFLDWLGRASATVFLPNRKGEGFYLPALEGMAAGTVVICPDCVGNRSFCEDGENCIVPPATEEGLVAAALAALSERDGLEGMRQSARRTAAGHDLVNERRAFQDILSRADELWSLEASP